RSRRQGPAEDRRLRTAVEAGLRESAADGVTSVGEIATAPHPQSAAASGPRLTVFREAIGLTPGAVADGHRAIVRDLERLAAMGIGSGISPHAPYSVAASLGPLLLAEARRRRLPMAMHLAESPVEAEFIATGGGPFRRLLEDLGAWDASRPPRLLPVADWISLLARSPRGIVVHGTFLPDDASAFSRLVRHRDRLAVVVCPRTTRALSGVLPPVRAFRSAGIRVAIGTDGRGSNPDLQVLGECRTLVEAGLATPAEAIAMATRHGAWALGRERRDGMLAPGRPADLAVLRPAAANADPHEAAVDPGSRVVATLRSGRVIAGETAEGSATAGSSRCSSR
ncbi:MAG: hypothetical protein EBZ59_05115, partial [Planctomycetia bacterium]|nr:hypothetical protein [Planctomycetia bacterium]